MKLLLTGGIVLFTTLFVMSAIIDGIVFSYLWGWFVAETFGIRTLSMLESIGLLMVLGYATKYKKNKDTGEDSETAAITLASVLIFAPLLTLFIGWVIHGLI
jgi:F0F1-type ATP synthase assembly protein I